MNMAKLTIVANITAKADKVDLVNTELEKLIDITRAEEGCLKNDLHQNNDNPARFVFYENWESRELWETHKGAQHLKDYMAATDGPVKEFTLNEMTRTAWFCRHRHSKSPIKINALRIAVCQERLLSVLVLRGVIGIDVQGILK